MLVTPLRDGMNLVAKEFVASRTDGDGVLVLSEFAGAAWELPEALLVNPYDVDGDRGRLLPRAHDGRRRSGAPVSPRSGPGSRPSTSTAGWRRSSSSSARVESPRRPPAARPAAPAAREEHCAAGSPRPTRCCCSWTTTGPWCRSPPTPDLARPDRSSSPCSARWPRGRHTEVHIVSGRGREALDHWLGELPVWLHAEHGFWSRSPEERTGFPRESSAGSWREPVLAILRDITARTPGSLIEVKAAALAWHYRLADPEIGARRANELRLHLNQLLSNQPVEILAGSRVLEIRPHGIHKGRIVAPLTPERLAQRPSWRSETTGRMRICSRRFPRKRSASGSGRDTRAPASASRA